MVALRVVGQAVLERLGHRPQPGQRRAQVVGDPGDQLAARLLQPAPRGRGTRPAARWCAASSSDSSLELGRAARRRRRTRPLSPNRRASVAQRPRPAHERRADQQRERPAATTAGDQQRPRAPRRSRGRTGTSPGRCRRRRRPRAQHRDERRRTAEQPAQRARGAAARPTARPTHADRAGPGGGDRGRWRPGRCVIAAAPSGSRRPRRSTSRLGLGRVGLDLLAQPADVHGHGRLVAERPAPDLAGAARRGRTRCPGCATQEAQQVELAGGQRERAARRASPRARPRSTTRSPSVTRAAGRAWPAPRARRSTESTRSTSSRGLNGLVT